MDLLIILIPKLSKLKFTILDTKYKTTGLVPDPEEYLANQNNSEHDTTSRESSRSGIDFKDKFQNKILELFSHVSFLI